MSEKLIALLSMFVFGLVCGMMLRDWQERRRLVRERETRLRHDYNLWSLGRIPNVPNVPPPPPLRPDDLPVPKIPAAMKGKG